MPNLFSLYSGKIEKVIYTTDPLSLFYPYRRPLLDLVRQDYTRSKQPLRKYTIVNPPLEPIQDYLFSRKHHDNTLLAYICLYGYMLRRKCNAS